MSQMGTAETERTSQASIQSAHSKRTDIAEANQGRNPFGLLEITVVKGRKNRPEECSIFDCQP